MGAKLLEGYKAGAVDYLFKPVDPTILRSKVDVFVALYRHAELKLRAATLEAANRQLEQDLEVQAKLAEQIAHLNQHDLLTGLSNRSALEQHLELALEGALDSRHSVALALLDLGGFKSVVDNLGHAAADALLREAAARLRGVARAHEQQWPGRFAHPHRGADDIGSRPGGARALGARLDAKDAAGQWPDGSVHWLALRARVLAGPLGQPLPKVAARCH